jgi:hypothetical protein
VKVIASSGKKFLAEITATEVARLKGFASLVAWLKAEPGVNVIGCEVDIGQALADVGEGTVGRKKIEAAREQLAAGLKRLDAALAADAQPEPEVTP